MDNKEMLAILNEMAKGLETMRAMIESDIVREWDESRETTIPAGSWLIVRVGASIPNPNLIAFIGERTVETSPNTGEYLPPYVMGLSKPGLHNQKNWTQKRYAHNWDTAL